MEGAAFEVQWPEELSLAFLASRPDIVLVGHFRLPLPLAFFTAVLSAKGFSLGIAA